VKLFDHKCGSCSQQKNPETWPNTEGPRSTSIRHIRALIIRLPTRFQASDFESNSQRLTVQNSEFWKRVRGLEKALRELYLTMSGYLLRNELPQLLCMPFVPVNEHRALWNVSWAYARHFKIVRRFSSLKLRKLISLLHAIVHEIRVSDLIICYMPMVGICCDIFAARGTLNACDSCSRANGCRTYV